MAYLKQIVNYINSELRTGVLKGSLQDAQLFGIAMTAPRKFADGAAGFMPIVFEDSFDDGRYVGIDDTYSANIYHKNNGFVITPTQLSVGDKDSIVKKGISMSMIVFSKLERARMTPEELFDQIDNSFPDKISTDMKADLKGLHSVAIRITGVNFNTIQILSSEYKLEKMAIAPSDIFFQVNYIIECTYKKGCIETCCN